MGHNMTSSDESSRIPMGLVGSFGCTRWIDSKPI